MMRIVHRSGYVEIIFEIKLFGSERLAERSFRQFFIKLFI